MSILPGAPVGNLVPQSKEAFGPLPFECSFLSTTGEALIFYCFPDLAQGNCFPLFSSLQQHIVPSPAGAYLLNQMPLPTKSGVLFCICILLLFYSAEYFKGNIYQLSRVHSKCREAFQVVLVVNNPPANAVNRETWVQSLDWEDPLEEGMTAHPSILAGGSHGQRNLVATVQFCKEQDMTECLFTHAHIPDIPPNFCNLLLISEALCPKT